jgi:hypothetical protein
LSANVQHLPDKQNLFIMPHRQYFLTLKKHAKSKPAIKSSICAAAYTTPPQVMDKIVYPSQIVIHNKG